MTRRAPTGGLANRTAATLATLPVLLLAMLALTSATAAAVTPTEILSQDPDGSRAKPSTLFYGGYPFAVGESYTATGLHWQRWGGAIARSTGRLKVCPNMGTCRRYPIKVAASGLVKNAEGTGKRLYSFVSFTRIGRGRPLVKLCIYAEACRPGPVR